MSKLAGIENTKPVTFRWTGGLDYSTSPEAISPENLSRADNVEYDASGILTKAEGIVPLFDSGAVSVCFPFNGKTIYNNSQNLYYVDLTVATASATLIGTLTGTNLNKQSFVYRDSDLLIASGGKLQKLTTSWALTTDGGSPNCDKVFIDNGRIMVSLASDTGGTDSDYLYWAAIEDDTSWDLSPTLEFDWSTVTASQSVTPLFLEVGYRDGLNITDVQFLSQDIIVTKTNGAISRQYRVTGFYDTWQVTALEPSFSIYDAVAAVNDIYAIGLSGFKSLKNVIQYGDVARDETGIKVNIQLTKHVDTNAKVWHIPLKKQIAVKIANDKTLWLFHYNQRNALTNEIGAWTKRICSGEITHIWESNNAVYVAMGSKLCRFDSDISTQDSAEFIAKMAGRRFTSAFQFDFLRYSLDLENKIAGTGQLMFGGVSEILTFSNPNDVAYDDADVAYDDTDIAAGDTFKQEKKWIQAPLSEDFTVQLTCNTGSIGFRTLTIDYAEV
jgi:hypothetical protein